MLTVAYSCSTVYVGSEPDGFVGAGAGVGPPCFAGNAGWIGRDAGFTGLHVTEHLDGIFCASSVWIQPVFTCNNI